MMCWCSLTQHTYILLHVCIGQEVNSPSHLHMSVSSIHYIITRSVTVASYHLIISYLHVSSFPILQDFNSDSSSVPPRRARKQLTLLNTVLDPVAQLGCEYVCTTLYSVHCMYTMAVLRKKLSVKSVNSADIELIGAFYFRSKVIFAENVAAFRSSKVQVGECALPGHGIVRRLPNRCRYPCLFISMCRPCIHFSAIG